jgi:nucleolar protein 4
MHADRIEEAAKHELTSVKRKKEKGRIVGLKGRVVAVDWALAKAEYQKMEAGEEAVAADEIKADKEEEEDSDMVPVPYKSDSDDDEDESGDEDEEEDDMSPVPEDLAAPSDIEDESEEAKPAEHKPDQGTTLFVRNIQFEATEDELYNLFKAFGPVKYARIVMDPVTKRSRGTGFVNFYKEESALQCLEEADKLALTSGSGSGAADGKGNKGKGKAIPQSLLTADPSSALAAKLTLHGRVLGVSSAVSKGQADSLREERDRKGGNKDRRNLYLMHEGSTFHRSNTPKVS